MAVELRPHQKQAVKDLSNGKVLWGGVGAGKSITVAAYYMENEAPRDIYVITTARKRDTLDWEKEFVKFGIYKSEDATVAGVLHVDSWNNLGKYTTVHDAFFIFDEQRLVGSGAWTKAFLHIAKSNRWVLLSATPGDTWLDYVPVFLANGFYKNRTEFKREHVVYNTYSKFPKVDHYVGANKLVKLKNQVLVEMPYTSHTVRHTKYIDVDHDKESFHKALVQRWHVFEQRPIRDVAELFMVMRKIVNSDPSRLETVRCLMEKHPKLIVFYNFNYELEMLRTLADNSSSFSISSPGRKIDSDTGSQSSFPDLETSRQNDLILSSATGEVDPSRSTERSGPPSSDSVERSTRSTTTSPPAQTSGSRSTQSKPSNIFDRRNQLEFETQVDLSGTSTNGSAGTQRLSILTGTTTSTPDETRTATGSSSDSLEGSESSKDHDSRTERCSDKIDPLGTTGTTSTTTEMENDSLSRQRSDTRLSGSSRKSTLSQISELSLHSSSPMTNQGMVDLVSGNESSSVDTSTSPSGTPLTVEPNGTASPTPETTFQLAEWNGHKHDPVPDTDRWVYLVQYTAGSEGWNCTDTDAMVFYSLTYSYKHWHQAFGRIDRLNTPFKDLYYYVLRSRSVIDRAIENSLKHKKAFNESSMNIKF